MPLAVNLESEVLRESYLVERFPGHPYLASAVAFRVGICLVVAVAAGGWLAPWNVRR